MLDPTLAIDKNIFKIYNDKFSDIGSQNCVIRCMKVLGALISPNGMTSHSYKAGGAVMQCICSPKMHNKNHEGRPNERTSNDNFSTSSLF